MTRVCWVTVGSMFGQCHRYWSSAEPTFWLILHFPCFTADMGTTHYTPWQMLHQHIVLHLLFLSSFSFSSTCKTCCVSPGLRLLSLIVQRYTRNWHGVTNIKFPHLRLNQFHGKRNTTRHVFAQQTQALLIQCWINVSQASKIITKNKNNNNYNHATLRLLGSQWSAQLT